MKKQERHKSCSSKKNEAVVCCFDIASVNECEYEQQNLVSLSMNNKEGEQSTIDNQYQRKTH